MKMIAKTMPALLLVLAACGGGGSGDDTSTPDANTSSVESVTCAGATIAATITTSGFAYSPASATISAGEIVQFSPAASHDVKSGAGTTPDGLFQVGFAGNGCFQFNDPGTYPFFCSAHLFTGTLTVQ